MNHPILSDLSFFLIVFYTALLCSLVLVPLSKKLALATGLLDHPDTRKVHSHALPRLGGLGIAGAALIALALCIKMEPPVVAYLLGAAIIIFTGLLDDIVTIPPPMKFLGQILAALVFITGGGGEVTHLGDLLGMGDIRFGPFSLLFSVFAMVGIMNAINLCDGLDGLAGGISATVLVFYSLFAYTHQAWLALAIILAVLGAVLGFLCHNSHPAKLFMGDTGSLFLGFTLAALAVRLASLNVGIGVPVKPVVLAVIISLPIADTLLVMVKRVLHGVSPFQPDNTHLHHRLMQLGLRHNEVVTVIYALMFCCGGLAWFGIGWAEWWLFALAVTLFISLYLGIAWCERHGINLGRLWVIKDGQSARKGGVRKYILSVIGRSSRFVFPLFLFFFFLPVVLTVPSPWLSGVFSLALALFIILLYPWRGGRREMPMAHGVFFVATFVVVLGFWSSQSQPLWLVIYGNSLSLLALLWVTPQILWRRYSRTLMPVGFELMLIALVWFVPLILAPVLGATEEQQRRIAWACIQAMPMIVLIKLTVKRHARRNRTLALAFISALAGIGIWGLWGKMIALLA